MKFACERCQTRYSIPDEKVRQKILNIRCKACGAVITIRDPASAIEPAVNAAGASASRPPAPRPPPLPRAVEWFVAVNGQQSGALTRTEAARRIMASGLDDDVYVWKDGFEAWKPTRDVPSIMQEIALQRARTSQPAPPALATVAMHAAPPIAAALSALQPRSGAPALGPLSVAITGRSGVSPPFPGTPKPVGNGTPEAGSRSAIAEGAAVARGGFGPPAFFPPPSVLPVGGAPPSESVLSKLHGLPGLFARRPALKLLTVGSVVVALLLLVVVWTVKRPGERKSGAPAAAPVSSAEPMAADDVEQQARAAAEQWFREVVPDIKQPMSSPVHADRAVPVARRSVLVRSVTKVAGRAVITPPPLAPMSAEQEAASRRLARYERKVAILPAGGPRSAAAAAPARTTASQLEIQAVVKDKVNQDAIKTCYERALKRDDRLRSGRIDVTVSVGLSGTVRSVMVSAPPEFSVIEPCIRISVKLWRFPPSSEEYATSFPLILQGRL